MTETTPDQLPYDRLEAGLLHGPRQAPWDPETSLWACSTRARFGVLDGWLWATDNATALAERREEAPDTASQPDGRKVLELLRRPSPGPLYSAQLVNLAVIGGLGKLVGLGSFDLDRVREAAVWAIPEGAPGTTKVILALDDSVVPLLRIFGTVGVTRLAAVIGIVRSGWIPTIDLPILLEKDAK